MTGVYFREPELGVASYDKETQVTSYYTVSKLEGYYHGTGDVFASALLAGLLNDYNLTEAAETAVRFTVNSIFRTYQAKTDYRFGVNFEQAIPSFLKELRLT